MKFDSVDLALTVVFAALYVAGVVFLAPLSFEIFQVRVADALLPLSVIFGFPTAAGTSLGCFVANFYGGLGIVDVVGGAFANFVACVLAWRIGGKNIFRRFASCLAETLVITLIVGSYLSMLFEMPIETGLLGVFIGSFVAINILGFSLLEALHRSGVTKRYVKKR
ncbi:MAG: QueT transporter family protein [Candidatus Bathyarchaeia archaeon]